MGFLNLFGRKREEQEQLTHLVLDYILTPDEAVDAFLAAHNDALLSDEADKIFERLLKEAQNDPGTSLRIRERYNRAERVLVEEMPTLLPTWVEERNELAAEYLEGPGEWAEKWSKSVQIYEETLEALDPFKNPDEWGSTSFELGKVYQTAELPGDRGILNWALKDEAVSYFVGALFGWTRDRFPQQWAKVQLNLGLTLLTRRRGHRWENLDLAIQCFQRASEVLTREENPVDWVYLQSGLGLAYEECTTPDIEKALSHFQNALSMATHAVGADMWATLQYYLGSTYLERKLGERADNVEQALHHLQQAIGAQGRTPNPETWILCQTALGKTYAARRRGSHAENVERAIAAFRQVLQGHDLEDSPDLYLMTQGHLGNLYLEEKRWNEAHQSYWSAMEAQELLYQAGGSTEERHSWLHAYNDLQVNAAYCLARLGRFDEAVIALEKGKARALGEALARHEAALELARPQDRTAFLAIRQRLMTLEAQERIEEKLGPEEVDLRDEICEARDLKTVRRIWESVRAQTEAEEDTRPSESQISSELREAREALEEIVTRIRGYAPAFMQVRMDFAGLAALASEISHPLVYLLTTPVGSLALIVEPGVKSLSQRHIVWLDDFKEEDLGQLLYYQREDQPYYLQAAGGEGSAEALSAVLDKIWPVLWKRLMGPVTQRLLELRYPRAVLLPSLSLGLLPLSAIAFDHVLLTCAPSARALALVSKRAQAQAGKAPVMLGIGNPHNAQKPLPFARVEVEESAAFFPTQARRCLYERRATRAAVAAALPGATHLHFACHGTFSFGYELDSALLLAGDDELTLRDLLDGGLDLSTARLTVLSACQTGVADIIKAPEEVIGFPAGFLQAGVPAVISTLWSVTDISTALLLTRFYRCHLKEGHDSATALHLAQDWLRSATAQALGLADLYQRVYQESGQKDAEAFRAARYYRANPNSKPFTHPYYWAGFVFSGASSG